MKTKVFVVIFIVLLVAVISLLWAYPVMWCWNFVMPSFGLPLLTWGKAWCLHFLTGTLLKTANYADLIKKK